MNETILRLEELAINAFPAIFTELYDGWILRYSNGYTNRGNSVNPLYLSKINIEEKIDFCESKYFEKGLPCIFKMTEIVESELDIILENKGYKIEKKADIMELNLDKEMIYDMDSISINFEASSEWLNDFLYLNGTTKEPSKSTAKRILSQIQNPVFCASISKDNKTVACGLGVLEEGKIGLYDIRVLEEYKRNGLGMKICKAIISEGIKHGAISAYLQVATLNATAIQLYSKLGFQKTYTYWYRIKNISTMEKTEG